MDFFYDFFYCYLKLSSGFSKVVEFDCVGLKVVDGKIVEDVWFYYFLLWIWV